MLQYVELVEQWGRSMGRQAVGRDFITEALDQIDQGKVKVEKYPTGMPSLKQTFELAESLQLSCKSP